MKAFKRVVMAVVLVTVVAGMGANASAEIKFGALPHLTVAELQAMYTPLVEYLARETGEKVVLVIPKDFKAFEDAVKAGQIDVGLANPLVYVQLKNHLNIDPLALISEAQSGTRLRGIMIVRKDSGISRLQDLKGKKISFVDKDSGAGYMFQVLLLSRAGLDVKNDVAMLPFAKNHDNVALAVFNKTADAGGIRESAMEKMKDKVDLAQLRIVGYTDYFPNWPVFSTPKLNKETAAKIQAALLKLKPNDPQNEKILGRAKLTGFIAVADKEYDDLRKAAKIAGAL